MKDKEARRMVKELAEALDYKWRIRAFAGGVTLIGKDGHFEKWGRLGYLEDQLEEIRMELILLFEYLDLILVENPICNRKYKIIKGNKR